MARKPTLTSLATTLGVSRQTISNAINRPEIVRPDTLARILAEIDATGYVPSRAARQLRTARSRTIAIRLMPTFDGINGHILDLFLHELAEQARRDGYRLALFAANDDADEIAEYDTLFAAGEVDGAILTSTRRDDPRIAWFLDRGLPFVPFGRPWSEAADPADAPFSWVDVDGAAGARAATRRLAEAGHRRIGYLSWPVEPGVGLDRFRGWQEAMAEAGTATAGLSRQCPDGAQEGALAARELVAGGATAVVCASDSLALGALAAMTEDGRTDVVIVGFDDTPVARALGMNSVTQPVTGAARSALALLLEVLADREPRHVLLDPTPVFRSGVPAPLSPTTN